VRRPQASHVTVVLSKAALSGPSVCLRARDPCSLRVSCPLADRAESAHLSRSLPWSRSSDRVERAAQLQALAFRCCPWVKTGYEPCVQSTHGLIALLSAHSLGCCLCRSSHACDAKYWFNSLHNRRRGRACVRHRRD
jgi:hypothetical protein